MADITTVITIETILEMLSSFEFLEKDSDALKKIFVGKKVAILMKIYNGLPSEVIKASSSNTIIFKDGRMIVALEWGGK